MSWYTRAPHAGWYVVLTLALCILAVSWAAFAIREAKQLAGQARATLDSLSRGRWVRLDSGDVLIKRKAGP